MREFDEQPVFENGRAMPVFPFTGGKTGEAYDPETSAVVRFCVYVETDYDMDGDGKRDLVKAFVQVPRSAVMGHYKAPVVFEARPYCAGINADGYDHMKETAAGTYADFDLSRDLDHPAPARKPASEITAMEAALAADPAGWYYPDRGNGGNMVYENIDNFNYYLVRGFAVVVSAGFGSKGSDGLEFVGSHYERDAFCAVVEWLHGDRQAFADRAGTAAIRADWCNGNVGMTGRSYAGTMPFAVASAGTKGLRTIVPVAGIADWYSQQNQQGAQRYWPEEMLNSFLSYYCSSRYSDDLTEEQRSRMDAFHHALSMEQLKTGTDYSPFWEDGNYTLHADRLNCSALIVHGLHDENVSTKQFEMMLRSFRKAGQTVKLILHQGYHMTPAMPDKGFGIRVNGAFYEDIVNRWFSHYLFGVENDAEDMPAVLVQSNLDQHVWEQAADWETGRSVQLHFEDAEASDDASGAAETEKTIETIDTDWDAAGICQENFDERMSLCSSNMNRRYITAPLKEACTIQGTVRVDFRASLAGGDPAGGYHAVNAHDADSLTFSLGTSSGQQDDLKLTVLLVDLANEPFPSIFAEDPQRNVIPTDVVRQGAFEIGGGLKPLDEVEFRTEEKNYSVITRAYIDLCNPDSGYEPETAAAGIRLEKGEFHDYHVYLNAARYTAAPGHRLAVVIGTEDPVYCLIHKEYSVQIDRSTVSAEVPVL